MSALQYDDRLRRCPICGSKAVVMHAVVDGFEFGWDCGCPRFKLNDKYHRMDENTPEKFYPKIMYSLSRDDAIERWNRWCEFYERSRHERETGKEAPL